MRYISITAADDLYLSFINRLYHEAFPPHERRDWDELLNLMGSAAEMHVQVILQDENPVGMIIFWTFADWNFIEYFAIDPACRGLRYGEKVMMDFSHKNKVLLEVELPISEDAVRRIKFYERVGMVLLPFAYQQPSYREKDVSYEMTLMSNRPDNEHKEFDDVLLKVLKAVYGQR
ncbi:GNAT family N-acetyltransferase [Pedobacter sp. L105]|uniref:GNAT family N-acetyltransferase n=1 Tax=Pedobacter sp. L105 TaxID=1641871 RepID=UPI00131CF3BB|nr:GNAT family N-acetyltransferase [Pedobacter sp. L105]